MRKIILIICQGCRKIRRFSEWISLSIEERQELIAEAQRNGAVVQKVFDICDQCFQKKCQVPLTILEAPMEGG